MSAESKKCVAIDHPNLMPGYGCCQCKTYNGNNRSTCKTCNHQRCDNPKQLLVPIQEEGGIRIVQVKQEEDKKKAN